MLRRVAVYVACMLGSCARACMLFAVLMLSLLVPVGRPSCFCALAAARLFLPSFRLLPRFVLGSVFPGPCRWFSLFPPSSSFVC